MALFQVLFPLICLFGLLNEEPPRIVGNDWPGARGVSYDGVAGEAPPGDVNALKTLWRVPFDGAGVPVLHGGRIYVQGRSVKEALHAERLAAFNAESGDLIWEKNLPVYNTSVPRFHTGGGVPCVDLETGNLITVGAGGMVHCFNPNGRLLWYRCFVETFGVLPGATGAAAQPVVVDDLVVLSFVSIGWGVDNEPRHRLFAADKKTGEIRWIASPGQRVDNHPVSAPVPAEINGRRLLIHGNGDGTVYALDVGTGDTRWSFRLSENGVAPLVAVAGKRVFAAHAGRNSGSNKRGRVVCIDGAGSGDVTDTHLMWRLDGVPVDQAALTIHGSDLFVIDEEANLHMLNQKTGRAFWRRDLGTRTNTSSVFAGGLLYTTESRGRMLVLDPRRDRCRGVVDQRIAAGMGRDARFKSAPIPAFGRLFLVTDRGIHCLGDPDAPFEVRNSVFVDSEPAPEDAVPVRLQVIPAEAILESGTKYNFRAAAFDADGRFIKLVNPEWNLQGLQGDLTYLGEYTPADVVDTGFVAAEWNGIRGKSRVRVFSNPPWLETFDDLEDREMPPYWVGGARPGSSRGVFLVVQAGANKVLEKPVAPSVNQEGSLFLGPHDASGYVVQADVMGFARKRFLPDIGLYSHGRQLRLSGLSGRLELDRIEGDSVVRAFDWSPDIWYTMKIQVEFDADGAWVRGKIWRAAEEEPKAWTISGRDSKSTRKGAPGLYSFSRGKIHFDNIRVYPPAQPGF